MVIAAHELDGAEDSRAVQLSLDSSAARRPGQPALDAVTFDFWNTLLWEEPGSLRQKRLEVWIDSLEEIGARVDRGRLERAHDAAHERYVESWAAGRQFRVADAVEYILDHLDGELDATTAPLLTEGFSDAGRKAAIHPSDGVHECLTALTDAGVRLGIVCDIGLTPSAVVCELLERHDLRRFFCHMSFSDEVGHYKPAREIFEHALTGLGATSPECAAHVGDRRRTDVGGAISMGMIAVRYNGTYEDEIRTPEADIIVSALIELPAQLGVATT
jgi:FMN phosphatase YigB (HAD superfamily)